MIPMEKHLKNYYIVGDMPEAATKIRLIWDAIPSQIARENNKFIFSHVKQGARAKDLEDALDCAVWIDAAGADSEGKEVCR